MSADAAVDSASRAYAYAAALDPRLPDPDPVRIRAWADVLTGTDVWPDEAVQAVRIYYQRPNPYPIMPGDVIAIVKTLPPNTSEARLRSWFRAWSEYPYSGQIQRITGMCWEPTYPTPEGIHGDPAAERAYHVAELKQWVRDNWTTMMRAALAREIPAKELDNAQPTTNRELA
ncbi:hypothetical protein NONI108955_21270 [Nocardia ninae]|uniref:Uncharacterized protein n=1 Tax=Nocardia ninae NBRC 108245 TaxID=1210091 RepID=A0A511MCJ2_9NOCA|nr:hypothetical protein [Nocardia ninae]GEM37486.1 hypothetical protein NN4_20050 [Nocardia ninae NBRC 108245]